MPLTKVGEQLRLTDHGFQLDGTHHEVVEGDASVLAGVPVTQDVQDVVVESVTGRVQSLSQLKRTQVALRLLAVQLVY